MTAKTLLQQGIDYIGTAVVYFCHDGEGKFVMALRSVKARDEHGVWDIGGGAIELHSTVEETLWKEIKEEYCTDIIEYEFLGYRDVHRTSAGKPTHWIALDFKVRVDAKKVANGEPHKFKKVSWFTLDDLPENIHSQMPHFLELYRTRLETSEQRAHTSRRH